MSLQTLADQMKSRGRNGDSELVHMTKGEVAGLQQLAMAAGGTLTINPDTGLPEASFLKSILPGIIGAVSMFIPGMQPVGAAMLGAGAGALTNKQDPLMGALMGGLGGYGGAGLGAGLNTAGTAAAQAAATPAAEIAANQALNTAAQNTMGVSASGLPFTGAEADVLRNQAMGAAYDTAAKDFAAQPFLTRAGQGIQALGDAGGRTAFMQGVGGLGGLAKSGAMGAAPMIYDYMMPKQVAQVEEDEEKDTEDLMGRYKYESGYTGGTSEPGSAYTGERRYFQPRYVRAAQGGAVKKFADGGEAAAPSSEDVADPARGMTGESADALRYLYGMAPQSPATRARLGDDAGAIEVPTTAASNQKYIFDPNTQRFLPNPNYVAPKSSSSKSDFGSLFSFGSQPAQQYDVFGNPVGGYGTSYGGLGGGGFGSNMNFGGWGAGGAAAGGEVRPEGFSEGGLASLARGGMKAGGFVVPADVVSMVGEGNTEAGYERIKRMLPGATPIKGKDGGQADTVKTSIEGKQPARIAHGEMYVPPAAVKRAGGAKKLYAMMNNVRKQAKGDAKQIKPVDLKKAMA